MDRVFAGWKDWCVFVSCCQLIYRVSLYFLPFLYILFHFLLALLSYTIYPSRRSHSYPIPPLSPSHTPNTTVTNPPPPATLGISTYAANALGDVVYIEMPEAGLEVSAGEAIGAVESVKSASDILSPVGGKVVEVNEELQDKPGQLNKDPEGAAWLARLEVEGEAEGKLMSEEEYKAFTEEA